MQKKIEKALRNGFSPKMAYMVQAMTGFDFGVRDGRGNYSGSLSITSDGYIIGASNSFLGSADDMDRNLVIFVQAAKLTEKQAIEFDKLYKSHVTDWRN